MNLRRLCMQIFIKLCMRNMIHYGNILDLEIFMHGLKTAASRERMVKRTVSPLTYSSLVLQKQSLVWRYQLNTTCLCELESSDYTAATCVTRARIPPQTPAATRLKVTTPCRSLGRKVVWVTTPCRCLSRKVMWVTTLCRCLGRKVVWVRIPYRCLGRKVVWVTTPYRCLSRKVTRVRILICRCRPVHRTSKQAKYCGLFSCFHFSDTSFLIFLVLVILFYPYVLSLLLFVTMNWSGLFFPQNI